MCTAYYADIGTRCGRPGQRVTRGCMHEHVTETYACEEHITMAVLAYCGPCLKAGHDCPVTIVPVDEVTP